LAARGVQICHGFRKTIFLQFFFAFTPAQFFFGCRMYRLADICVVFLVDLGPVAISRIFKCVLAAKSNHEMLLPVP